MRVRWLAALDRAKPSSQYLGIEPGCD